MLNITSQTVSLSSSQDEVFDFLCDLNNYNQLLPEKNISDFSSSTDTCQFKIQNIYMIGLEKNGTNEQSEIRLKSSDNSPVKFDLLVNLSRPNGTTEVFLDCKADVSGMLKMMVENPLKNLFSHMADKLKEVKG